MPPRLPAPGALRALQTPAISIRAFSSTTAVSVPPRDPTQRTPSATPSSSNSLLSITNSNRPARTNNNNNNPGDAAARLLGRLKEGKAAGIRYRQAQVEYLRSQKNSNDYLKQMPRRWDAGDVYSPHDMSPVEMQKWRKRSPRSGDVVDALGIRPLDMYKNFSLVQEFTSTSGQITHSAGTSLRPVNQRKIAKMIRRVQGMGLYPTIHDHPEMIRDDFFPPDRR